MKILTNIRVACMTESTDPYTLIDDGVIVMGNGMIEWVGDRQALPAEYQGVVVESFDGQLVTPALIDCHTHIVSGGDRAQEFEMRLTGVSYEEIAKSGGGILSTVNATRSASEEELVKQALPRVDAFIDQGVSVLEIKSGYGLDPDTELKMLRAARAIEKHRSIKIITSYLGAHAIAPEFHGDGDAYIDEVCLPTLEMACSQGLVDMVDGFCEGIAFSPTQISRVFDLANKLNLPVKLHAEQLSNLGGAKLAAAYGALSADHIEYLDEEGVKAMADAGTCAVILPGAFYTLRETQVPPIDLLRKHNVPMAVSTDCNPGSSPMTSLLLAMNMACTLFRMTPEEALAGVTKNAAKALGLSDRGEIKTGMRADFALWNVQHPAELAYRIGFNPLHKRILGG